MTDNIPTIDRKKDHYLKSYEIIASNFIESPLTVGIDKITLSFDANVSIDKQKFNLFRKNFPKNININSLFLTNGKINNISYKDSEIGKISILGNNINKNGQCLCNFELINGSLNIKTSNIAEIKERLFISLIE
ncbi:TPA: hypothetical protein ACGOZN_002375, partial [Streptococcus suis]